ncbi:hypothetical protein HDG40_005186 [Paraburkholderia sp. JPY158]|uniref:Uncharacterized protein n=1 Tax=Paraburkholderia atlantica TaxID=2654982 RepID=A0A7W8QAU3_PARAM|nr:hypothetical protein [Paraburkholderia atlantica]MBB5427007.1 hypothetical protein [Paraburkholderia atlantica]
MKAPRNYNDAANELKHISAMVQRLEQLVKRDCLDWQGTIVARPAYWRARIEANAELPPALQPQARLLLARLATLEARSERRGHRA